MKNTFLLLASALLAATQSFSQSFVTTGTSKYVLLEEATGSWTGWAPDGHQDIMQSIVPLIPHAIVVSWHSLDSLTITGDPFCGGSGYISAFPTATIDRATIGSTIAQSRPWESAVSARTVLSPNFQVDMSSTYNPVTRLLTVTVSGKALTSLTGTWNINALVVEDSVSSAGTGYSQVNYYDTLTMCSNGMPTWWNGLGSPMAPGSYSHMNVVRAVLATGGSIWGDGAFFSPASGTTASRVYTYTLPASYNAAFVKVVGMVQQYGSTTADRVVENAISSEVSLMPPGSAPTPADSFDVYTSATCSGSDFFVSTNSFYAGMSIYTEYGDGTTSSNPVLSGASTPGYASFSHTYATPGTYTVKQVLVNGTGHIDSVTYSNEYRLCNVLSARFYYDGNSNCTYDASSPLDVLLYSPVQVEIDSNGVPVDTIYCTSGFYYTAYGVPGDIYSIRLLSADPDLVVACPSSGIMFDTLTALSYSIPSNDFGFNCASSTAFDLAIHTTTRAYTNRCIADILVSNANCTPTAGVVTMNFSPKYVYSSASPAPTSVSGTTLTWNIADLSLIYPQTHIHVSLMNGPAGLLPTFDTVHTAYSIAPTTGDGDPSNNTSYEIDSAIGSYDPNFVEVTPAGCIGLGVTDLLYTIGFENTGGDTARNIYVLDTISNNLDFASIKPAYASAPMNIYKYTAGGYNIVKFDFPNIMLPDSSHHDLCHGLVTYQIKTRSLTAYGTQIPARVGIYFDANPEVMTNTVINTTCLPTFVTDINNAQQSVIFPNPVSDELTINVNSGAFARFTVTNSVGQTVMDGAVMNAQTRLDVKELPKGVYYLQLKGAQGSEIKRFVKW